MSNDLSSIRVLVPAQVPNRALNGRHPGENARLLVAVRYVVRDLVAVAG
jgi:hypothetical protein